MTNNTAKIRAALDLYDRLDDSYTGWAGVFESAYDALAELEKAAPQFVAGEVTRPMCHGAWARFWSEPNTGDSCDQARRWLEAWRAELGPALGLETQRHRDNEIDALEQKLARADARIAEMERDNERIDAQWRDELRIYRETENARIAELERSVTVRDTEIARLETDLELARRDAGRYRFVRMMNPREFSAVWTRTMCTCAQFDELIDAARAGNGGGV